MTKTVDEIALRKLSEAFDEFVRACMDDAGKPKAPTAKALARARGYLPPYCKSAYLRLAVESAPGITATHWHTAERDGARYLRQAVYENGKMISETLTPEEDLRAAHNTEPAGAPDR